MNVSKLMHRDVVVCSEHDSLELAAARMWDHDLGCLVIVDDAQRVAGVITDRDIAMAAYIQGRPLCSIPIASAMGKDVVTCREGDDLHDVEHAMRQRQIRRVPVVDDRAALVGIVTLNDIAHASYRGQLPSADVSSTLSAISQPRRAEPTAVAA